MENKVDAGHNIPQALDVAHIADVEFDLVVIVGVLRLKLMAHIVLLFLIAAENADLADIGGQEMLEHRMTKAAGTTGDQQRFIFKNGTCHDVLLVGSKNELQTVPL